jgi:uncharacterized protein YgbK (DUF1537 family)
MDQLIGSLLEAILNKSPISSLVLVGGNTACSVLKSLGADGIKIKGEFGHLIPYGELMGGPFEGLFVVTKGGATGKNDTLLHIVKQLHALDSFH